LNYASVLSEYSLGLIIYSMPSEAEACLDSAYQGVYEVDSLGCPFLRRLREDRLVYRARQPGLIKLFLIANGLWRKPAHHPLPKDANKACTAFVRCR